MEPDILTLGWVTTLGLLSLDLWLTYLTISQFYIYKRKKVGNVVARKEAIEIEKNIVVVYLIKKFGGMGFILSSIFTSAFVTIMFWYIGIFLFRDSALIILGAFIGMQSMMIQIHIYNLDDLRKWNSGTNP